MLTQAYERRTYVARLVLIALLAMLGLASPPSVDLAFADSYATNGRVSTSGPALQVRQLPSTTAPVVARLRNGTPVSVRCTAVAQVVSGRLGRSRIWNNIGPGLWISDAYTYTGRSTAIARPCRPDELRGQSGLLVSPVIRFPPCIFPIPEADPRLDPRGMRSWCDQLKDAVTGADPREYYVYKKTSPQIGEEGELIALAKVRQDNPVALVFRPKDRPKGYCLKPVFDGRGPLLRHLLKCADQSYTGGVNLDLFRDIPAEIGTRRPDIVVAEGGRVRFVEVKTNGGYYNARQRANDAFILRTRGWPTKVHEERVDPHYYRCANCRAVTA